MITKEDRVRYFAEKIHEVILSSDMSDNAKKHVYHEVVQSLDVCYDIHESQNVIDIIASAGSPFKTLADFMYNVHIHTRKTVITKFNGIKFVVG